MDLKPTIGRIVLYKVMSLGGREVFFASLITRVNEDESVSLTIFDPSEMQFKDIVYQGQEVGQWDWMPYTKEQASK